VPVQRVLNPMLKGLARHVEENGLKFADLAYDANLACKTLHQFKGIKPFRKRPVLRQRSKRNTRKTPQLSNDSSPKKEMGN